MMLIVTCQLSEIFWRDWKTDSVTSGLPMLLNRGWSCWSQLQLSSEPGNMASICHVPEKC